MVVIGFMGAMNVGKTAVLKLFVDYVEKNKVAKIDGGAPCTIEKVDFKGESVIPAEEGGDSYTKTVTPNKVVFLETGTDRSHTLFAPGGDKDKSVVRMGIITVSRIAKEVVAIFAVNESLVEQFQLYDLIRYIPKSIYVCFNKSDLIPDEQARAKVIEKMKKEIEAYFAKRQISIKDYFQTCAIDKPGMTALNDNTARMILDIALGRK